MRIPHILPLAGREAQLHRAMIDKAGREAENGRRLAMFDRQTGLYAHWYLELRFHEEARRAERYRRPLSVMLIETRNDDTFRTQDGVRGVLQSELRSSDLAAHLGDGRFLSLLTETSLIDASAIAARVAAAFPETVAIGLARCPEDGEALSELKEIAQRRSHGNWARAF